MNTSHTNQEINWKANTVYVDTETGEIIPKTIAKRNYIIIKKIKKTYVYKSTGTITYTNECIRSRQIKLF